MNIKFLFKIIFITIMLTSHFAVKAEIIETHNTNIIKNEILNLSAGDIALFDVKHVIFHSSDQLMLPLHKSFLKQKFIEIEQKSGKEEAARLMSIILSSYEPIIVDPEIPNIINNAQKAKILVFALTSGKTSEYGIIKSRADTRIKTLASFGINFSKPKDLSYINLGHISDEGLKENGEPIFKEGVIFASRYSKGEILNRFLKATQLKPKKIVFVDNKLKNVEIVGKKCQELGIEYLGIYYTKLSNTTYGQLDKKMAEKKIEVLLIQNKWISDKEAMQMLKESE